MLVCYIVGGNYDQPFCGATDLTLNTSAGSTCENNHVGPRRGGGGRGHAGPGPLEPALAGRRGPRLRPGPLRPAGRGQAPAPQGLPHRGARRPAAARPDARRGSRARALPRAGRAGAGGAGRRRRALRALPRARAGPDGPGLRGREPRGPRARRGRARGPRRRRRAAPRGRARARRPHDLERRLPRRGRRRAHRLRPGRRLGAGRGPGRGPLRAGAGPRVDAPGRGRPRGGGARGLRRRGGRREAGPPATRRRPRARPEARVLRVNRFFSAAARARRGG